MITKHFLYDFKAKGKLLPKTLIPNDIELRRSEKIESIAGLTKLAGENIDEFVVHIKNGYDWRLKSQR